MAAQPPHRDRRVEGTGPLGGGSNPWAFAAAVIAVAVIVLLIWLLVDAFRTTGTTDDGVSSDSEIEQPDLRAPRGGVNEGDTQTTDEGGATTGDVDDGANGANTSRRPASGALVRPTL